VTHISEVFAGSDMEPHLSAWAKSPLARSLRGIPERGVCAQKYCRIDEDVVQYMMTMMSIIIRENVIHKSLKKRRVHW